MTKSTERVICAVNRPHKEAIESARANMQESETLTAMAELYKVFGDGTRLRILSALYAGELCVCDICELLEMTKSAISHQLRVLRTSKLVKARRDGKEIFYSLSDDHIEKIFALSVEHIKE